MVIGLKRTVFASRHQEWEYVKAGIKTSIAPGALVCLIASSAFLHHFGTAAYIPAISATCFTPTLPRAKLLWYHAQTALIFALSYAYSLLAGWCGVQARNHTIARLSDADGYNGSEAAVVAIFFIFYFWVIFALKSAHQAWKLPCVVAGLYEAAVLPTMAAAGSMNDVLRIGNVTIEAFFAGQAFSLVIGLVVLPTSCRKGFLKNVRDGLQEAIFLEGTHLDLLTLAMNNDDLERIAAEEERLVTQLRTSLQSFLSKATQSRSDLPLAKQEVAYSRVDGSTLDELQRHVAKLVPLLSGIVSIAEILHTARKNSIQIKDLPASSVQEWKEYRDEMRTRSKTLSGCIISSAEDTLRLLELSLQISPKSYKQPSTMKSESVDGSLQAEVDGQDEKARDFGHQHHASGQFMHEFIQARSMIKRDMDSIQQQRQAVHYFMILNEQQVLSATILAIRNFTSSVQSLEKRPRRFIAPSIDSIQRHLRDIFGLTDMSHFSSPKWHKSTPTIQNRFANSARRLNQILYSQHAAFGLRGACAMISIGIIAFLPSTAAFYASQRFLWVLYAILLSLNETAGASTQSLCARFIGSLASMVASYLVWYIPDQRTPGILVFFWIWFIVLGYLYAKAPLIQGAWWVASFAAIVMVGNELQVRELGSAAVQAAGQAVYKPYILFPYRMSIVTLGILVAYFWTIFPKPMTEHQELRKCISSTLSSAARFNLVVQEIVKNQVFQTNHGFRDEEFSNERLWEAGRSHLARYQQSSSAARSIIGLLNWEISLGPSFSKTSGTQVLDLSEKILNQMSLIENIALSITKPDALDNESAIDQEKSLYPHLCPKGITNRLIDLSNAVSEGHLLAPDLDVLTLPHISYFLDMECAASNLLAASALIHAANYYMIQDVNKLSSLFVDVFGTLDFA